MAFSLILEKPMSDLILYMLALFRKIFFTIVFERFCLTFSTSIARRLIFLICAVWLMDALKSFAMNFVGNKSKVKISKRVFQENKALQIFRKTSISYPLIRTRTCAYQELRNNRFSENLACFVFLKQPFWDSPFGLLTATFPMFLSYWHETKKWHSKIKI